MINIQKPTPSLIIYVVHTTDLADVYVRSITKEFNSPTIITEGDCFYGWGERPNLPTCKLHVRIITDDIEMATGITQYLFSRDYEVVTTTSADEHENPVSLGTIPCRYSAKHTH